MTKSKSKYYVVWVGQQPGIYSSWDECQLQIKGYPNAKYKSFKTESEAKAAFGESAVEHIGSKKKNQKNDLKNHWHLIEKNSISVDAACSKNPGVMEYRGVITTTGEELFRKGPFSEGTNNIGEFLALVHALSLLCKMNKEDIAIYSDSRTAMAWVRNKKIKTTLKKTEANKTIFEMIDRALKWLHNNHHSIKILKWDTANWGEIPADFGRK